MVAFANAEVGHPCRLILGPPSWDSYPCHSSLHEGCQRFSSLCCCELHVLWRSQYRSRRTQWPPQSGRGTSTERTDRNGLFIEWNKKTIKLQTKEQKLLWMINQQYLEMKTWNKNTPMKLKPCTKKLNFMMYKIKNWTNSIQINKNKIWRAWWHSLINNKLNWWSLEVYTVWEDIQTKGKVEGSHWSTYWRCFSSVLRSILTLTHCVPLNMTGEMMIFFTGLSLEL